MSKTRQQHLNPPRTGTPRCETRKEWLLRSIALLDWYFEELDKPIPTILIQKEWPEDTDPNSVVGSCMSKWKVPPLCNPRRPYKLIETRIFIAPDVVEDLQVLETLVHELVHAVLPHDALHGDQFKDLADTLGLEGPSRTTYAGTKLRIKLLNISNTLGPTQRTRMWTRKHWLEEAARQISKRCFAQWNPGRILVTQTYPRDVPSDEWVAQRPSGIDPNQWFDCCPTRWSDICPSMYGACRELYKGVCEIYIEPIIDDATSALEILTHEMVHAVAGPRSGHTQAFLYVAALVGLRGDPGNHYPTDKLAFTLEAIAHKLGPYPEEN